MPLTPAAVQHTTFKVVRRKDAGYDIDEVDAFLDTVEAELARLLTENAELRERASAAAARSQAGSESPPPPAAPASQPAPAATPPAIQW